MYMLLTHLFPPSSSISAEGVQEGPGAGGERTGLIWGWAGGNP